MSDCHENGWGHWEVQAIREGCCCGHQPMAIVVGKNTSLFGMLDRNEIRFYIYHIVLDSCTKAEEFTFHLFVLQSHGRRELTTFFLWPCVSVVHTLVNCTDKHNTVRQANPPPTANRPEVAQ